MFIGTTPAFEIALYTYLYYAGAPEYELQLWEHTIKLMVINHEDRLITAYPVESDDRLIRQ